MTKFDEQTQAIREGPERCHMELRSREACSECGEDWHIEWLNDIPHCS